MTYGKHMEDFSDICQQVWANSELEAKRNLLRRAVNSFKYKQKQHEFLEEIAKASAERCDFLASSLILNKTDKVVKI